MSLARNIGNLPNGDDAPVFACRAWVNFDGTTNTAGFCTIRDSGNVSTVADNGTGDYTVNFATAMPDENYSVVFGDSAADSNNDGGWVGIKYGTTPSNSSFRIITDGRAIGEYNPLYVYCAVFR